MVLLPERGRIEETPLPRLLLGLYRARYGGGLRLSRERTLKTFLLHEGVPISAESNLASESLGVQLMDAGRISREDYGRVCQHVEQRGCREGTALLELGLLEPRELFVALKDQVRFRMVECFGWAHGKFALEPADEAPAEAHPFRADVYSLLQEGIESHWSADRVLADLGPKMGSYPLRTARLSRLQHRLRWDDAVQALCDAFDGKHTLWQALKEATTPRSLAAAWVIDAAQAIRYREPDEDGPDPEPPAGADAGPAIEIPVPPRAASKSPAPASPLRPGRVELEIVFDDERIDVRPALDSLEAAEAPPEAAADLGEDAERLRAAIAAKYARLGELDFYELLDVEADAAPDALKRAYLRAAKSHHPDALSRARLDPATREQASKVFAEMSRAYAVLSDPKRRHDYDASRDTADLDAEKIAMAETLYRKGEILVRQGNFRGAMEYLRPCVELWPEEAAYQAALGWALFKKMPSEPGPAKEHLQRAVELDGKDAAVLLRLSIVLRAGGESRAASSLRERARAIDPSIDAR